MVQWVTGYASRLLGDLDAAALAFESMAALGGEMQNAWTIVTALTDLANVRRVQGRAADARQCFERAMRAAEEGGAAALGFMGRTEAGYALVLLESGDVVAARRHAADSVRRNERWKNHSHISYSHLVMSLIERREGRLDDADESLRRAEMAASAGPTVPLVEALIDDARVALSLERGEAGSPAVRAATARCEKATAAEGAGEAFTVREDQEVRLLSLARVMSYQGRNEEALRLLETVQRSAKATGRLAYAEQAILVRRHIAAPEPLYCPELAEQLTQRESEVLALIAEGMANQEIAERLFVASGTVKAHTAAIYRGLDAGNRTMAVARARELGIV